MRTTQLVLALAAAVPALANASCGAAFCTVNTNWTANSALVEAGSSFDLRYEFIDQDQPMSGMDELAVGQIPHHHDELRTLNRNLVATYSRSFGNGLGLSVSAPLGDRAHTHIHNHHGEKISDAWNFTRVGDVRVAGRWQRDVVGDPLQPALAGVSLGFKLPTGSTGVANGDGDLAERSLQPGTGTTDLLLGAFYHRKLTASDASWFAQVQWQRALNAHANYKPGSSFGADIGLRKGLTDKLAALVQLNAVRKGRDSGSEAEPDDSGLRAVHLSPGLSYALTDNLQVYAYYQHALYRSVNGVQLTADRAFLVGLSGRL